MSKKGLKNESELARLGKYIDTLVSIGFGLGVTIIVVLFIYVLVTQFLTSS